MKKSIPQFSCLALLFCSLVASAETVTVRSGNGSILAKDPAVTFLAGPATTDFANPFSNSDFVAAQNGAAAFILSPNPLWVAGLSTDSSAHWVGPSVNSSTTGTTALYAIPFTISNTFNNATLTVHYAADDSLAFTGGSGGILLNGTAVCTNLIQPGSGQEHTLICNNVGPLVHIGQNFLYFDAVNTGGAAGVIFSATITTTNSLPPLAIPHFAVGDVWTTGFFVINNGPLTGNFNMRFITDSGSSVAIPFTGGLGAISSLSDSIPPNGIKYYETAAPSGPLIPGWVAITADSGITVQAIYRKPSAHGEFFEAAATSSVGSNEFVIPFDATTFTPLGVPLFTAFAVANLDPNNIAGVVCVARDQAGTILPGAVTVPQLNPLGHWADFNFPALAGKRGTIDCSSNTVVSAVVFRFIGNTVFSSEPVIPK